MSAQEPQYLATHLREALAADPRTAEMGVRVRVHGDDVYLSGEVACAERRERILQVARELVPDRRVHDELSIAHVGGRPEEERLS
ncbi:BON domain-containing protein [Marinactinospora thermotolerans]|uniref:Predicted periplasmic or secreted lipoprotein n=1 Tax=Marinactinospora thermotolerans DSM 45154 TaxID=1122192 RepID=A0A1T4K818_9ACTN|nr:BON domain-containing protein [Marinactinospora thermotolerans]SJZ38556.1 Predicted periplasmic or secreted lipoprotein [Marinactinospora thermotolerans DSM 45154]